MPVGTTMLSEYTCRTSMLFWSSFSAGAQVFAVFLMPNLSHHLKFFQKLIGSLQVWIGVGFLKQIDDAGLLVAFE